MKMAPRFALIARALVRPALRFCASNLLVAMLAAQCINVTQVPDQTISSGTSCYSNNDTLTAAGVTINGSASVTFVAGRTVHLSPGFRATAGTAGTTFHARVETVVTSIGATVSPTSVNLGQGQTQQFTATVTGTTNQQVTWSVAPTGTWSISSTGLFTAPGTITALQTVTVTATSAAQQTATGTATVTLVPPQPSKEYIRLGGRVIAIENYAAP